MAAAQLRAPLYEDKVVDFLFGKAEISDRAVTREELEAAIESEDGFASGTHHHDHGDHDHDRTTMPATIMAITTMATTMTTTTIKAESRSCRGAG